MNQFLGTSTLEISHEALIREWPSLTNWLQEAREDISLQQDISNDAREWELRGKPKDRLYRGSQFKEALAWQRRNTASGNEAAFLHACASGLRRLAVMGLFFGLLGVMTWLLPIIFLQFSPMNDSTFDSNVAGIIILFGLFIPIIGPSSSITGLVLSLRALRSGVYAVKGSRRWVAIVGLILSSIGILICVAVVVFLIIGAIYSFLHPNVR
jgi:hypothetical protein